MTRGRWLAVAVAAAIVLLCAHAAAGAVMNYHWYATLGAGALEVWRARAFDLAVLRIGAAIVAGLFLYVNLLGVATSVDAVAVSRRLGGIEIAETVPARRLRGVFALVSAVFGLAMALPISEWVYADALLTGRTFGEIEPYTGRDLAFFVYWLPFENGLYTWALTGIAFVAGAVVALYAVTPGLRWSRGRVRATVRVRRHLALFGVAILLLLAWGHRLDAYGLLVDGSGPNGAFTGVDDLAVMPARFVLAIISALAAVVVLRAGWAGQARLAFWAVTVVVVATIVGRSLVGPLAPSLLPPAQLAAANAAAAANRALYTRRAYAADVVRDGGANEVVRDPTSTPIWDAGALARLAVAPGDPRPSRAVVGWQPVDGVLASVIVAPRMSRPNGAEPNADGQTGWRATIVDPRSPTPLTPLTSTRPDVRPNVTFAGVAYPGAVDDSVVVDTGGRVAGDPFQYWGVRLAAALSARDLRLLRAPDAADDATRLVRRRDPRARVEALLPFFSVGRQTTPVVVGDSVWWAVELLAASADYPIAARLPGDAVSAADVSRLRHAGTALVNAATASVRIVGVPDADADVRGWYTRFPHLFAPASALPPAIAAALPPPSESALAQAEVYAEFGPRGTQLDAPRRVQIGDGADTALEGGPRRPVLVPADPSGTNAPDVGVSAITLPVLSTADRVVGLVMATGGPAPHAYWLPTARGDVRWPEVVDSTTADPPSSAPRSTGTVLLNGRLYAVPTVDGVLFVRSHYLTSPDGWLTLDHVSATRGLGVLRAASLRDVFGRTPADSSAGRPPALPQQTAAERLTSARALYDAARRELARGDLAAFARALDALGRALAGSP